MKSCVFLGVILLFMILPAVIWCSITSETSLDRDSTELDLTTVPSFQEENCENTTTELILSQGTKEESQTLLFKLKKFVTHEKFKAMRKIIYKIYSFINKFWSFIINLVWKPLLRLYLSPLRLIHSYILPELINAECMNVYHGDVHKWEDPLQPFFPAKLEMVMCVFQYFAHYLRSWTFVNRIEGNNYDLI